MPGGGMPVGTSGAGGSFGGGAGLGGSGGGGCGPGGGCVWGGSSPAPIAGPVTLNPTSYNLCSGCIDAETVVDLWGGETKLASNLSLGDELIGLSEAGCERKQVVTRMNISTQPRLRITFGDRALVCSGTHRLASSEGGFALAAQLRVGSRLRTMSDEPLTIDAIEEIEPGSVVDITCEPDHVYLACAAIHHNKTIWIAPR